MFKKYGIEELIEFLKAIDSYLERSTNMLIIGGTAAALAYKVTRRTSDIDTLSSIGELKDAIDKAELKQNLNIPIEQVSVADFPYNFEDRLINYDIKSKYLQIQVPEIHDLILMKVLRGYEHDMEAIKEMVDKNKVSKAILEDRFRDEMTHVIGDPNKLKLNLKVMLEICF